MIFGIILSFVASILFGASNLIEKHAVDRIPALSPRRSKAMMVALFTSPAWLVGFVASALALVLLVIALSLVPLAIAQAIFGVGLVPLVLASHIHLGEPLSRVEAVGLGTITVAIVFVAISLGSDLHPGIGGSIPIVLVVSLATIGVSCCVLAAGRISTADPSVPFGLASGLIYGAVGLQIKGISVFIERLGLIAAIPRILSSPYPYVLLIASMLGIVTFQTGIQRGRIVVVAPLTNVIAGAYVVAIGMVVFREPLPTSSVLATLRLVGFGLVLLGGCMLTVVSHAGQTTTESAKERNQTLR